MTAAVLLRGPHATLPARYGAAELKAASERHMSLAALLAAALVCLGTLTAVVLQRVMPRPAVVRAADPGFTVFDIHFPPPPALAPPVAPATSPGAPAVQGRDGIPVPVPDILPGHSELPDFTPGSPLVADPGTTPGPGGRGTPGGSATASQGSGDPPWLDRDVEPEVLTSPPPGYPEIAREYRVEGQVVLWVLVGTDGHVAQVRVRQGVPMLNEAAVEAVRRWLFRPALANGRPVAVWVAVPMRFALAERD